MKQKRSPRLRRWLAVGCAVLALAAAAALLRRLLAARAPTKRTQTWLSLFDTAAAVTGYADSDEEWAAQTDAVFEDLSYYNKLFDIYRHYDGMVNLYDVNAGAAAAPVEINDDLMWFLLWCKNTVYPQTDGAVNVAAGAVLRLWHDAREADAPAPPAADAVAEALRHIDMDALVLDEAANTVYFTDPQLSLDVGSVGKGYAVERTAENAEARGLTSALFNVGGNLRAVGQKPDGTPWTAGVENPWGDDPQYVRTVELAPGASLVVSGDYQRYFEYEGVRYAHLIDLTTGWPARHVSSVAVYVTDARSDLADALSTALFCLPVEDGARLVGALDGAEALWLHTDQTQTATSAWP